MRLFHGTTREAARAIIAHGFDVNAERVRDPGDFGWGSYLCGDRTRAACHGEVVLEVVIDDVRFARIANPYFIERWELVAPNSDVERLFHGIAFRGDLMLTCGPGVCPEERVATAKAIREAFLRAGYAGIISAHGGDETVLFDPGVVKSIRRIKPRSSES